MMDAVAPVLGASSTMLIRMPRDALGVLLALFGGFFIYISASDLLPESYHDHPTRWTTAMTILGAITIYIAVKLADM
jgi:ZIP family zinc transporter